MTDQRDKLSTDPGIGPVDLKDPSVSLPDAASDISGESLYFEPLPLVAVSDHKTLELETIKLSHEIDPRKQVTELRLPRTPLPPVFDSGFPAADVVLTRSQRPPAPARRWRTPALLLTLLAALLLLVLARAASHHQPVKSVTAAVPTVPVVLLTLPVSTEHAAKPRAAPMASASASASTAAVTSQASAVSAPAAAAAFTPSSVLPRAVAAEVHSAPKANTRPGASSQSLAAPTTAKPKRAIY